MTGPTVVAQSAFSLRPWNVVDFVYFFHGSDSDCSGRSMRT